MDKRNRIPETECQKQILEYLQLRGVFAWRNNTGVMKAGRRFVRFGLKGSGDILAVLPNGRFLSIEVKSNGEPISKDQTEFMDGIRRVNACAVVAYSLDDVVKFIEGGEWRRTSS